MAADPEFSNLTKFSTRELLRLWAGSLRELHSRKVVRTFNSPIGDIAEELVALHFGGERGSFSQKSWDVRTPDGDLLQVKAIRLTGKKGRRNLSPIRSDDYTAVIVVVFSEDVRVEQAIRVPRAVINEHFSVRPHVNGRIITLTDALLSYDGVTTFALSDGSLDAAP